jgi:hypothetical protein
MTFNIACIVPIIEDIAARRRRHLRREAVCQLIRTGSPIIPCFRRRWRPALEYNPVEFQLDSYTDNWCIEFLRFSRQEIREILPYLRLDLCPWRNRYHLSPEAAFCLLLYRLSWPLRYKDTLYIFGRSRSWQSTIYVDILQYLVRRYQGLLYWDAGRLTKSTLSNYATIIEYKCDVSNI